MASVRLMFLDKPFGHGLSIGVIGVCVQLALDGFHLLRADVRNRRQGLLGHGDQTCSGGDLEGIGSGGRRDGGRGGRSRNGSC